MAENILLKIYEHNNWANLQVIQACAALNDEQLDAEPQSATKGSIRHTLWHFMGSQMSYLSLLTGSSPPFYWQTPPSFAELEEAARISGEGFLDLARNDPGKVSQNQLRTRDGYLVDPWVVMVQAVNHATEHREQIKSMLTSLGETPPSIDGWDYGYATNALVPNPP